MSKKLGKKDSKIHKEIQWIFATAACKWGVSGPTDPDSNGCWANVVKEYEREFSWPIGGVYN